MYRGIVIVLCLILINSILTVINDSTIGNQTLSTMPKIMFTYKPQVTKKVFSTKTTSMNICPNSFLEIRTVALQLF